MMNTQMLTQCYTDVLGVLHDMTGMLAEDNTVEKIEQDLSVIEKVTVILKRIGETQVLETVEEDLDGHKNEEVGDDEV